MVDWDLPVEAVGRDGSTISVSIDRSYARRVGATPVKFPVNLWTGDGRTPGTWYFDDNGFSIGGMNQKGQNEGKFFIRNKEAA